MNMGLNHGVHLGGFTYDVHLERADCSRGVTGRIDGGTPAEQ
jgi:hypothetical protein